MLDSNSGFVREKADVKTESGEKETADGLQVGRNVSSSLLFHGLISLDTWNCAKRRWNTCQLQCDPVLPVPDLRLYKATVQVALHLQTAGTLHVELMMIMLRD